MVFIFIMSFMGQISWAHTTAQVISNRKVASVRKAYGSIVCTSSTNPNVDFGLVPTRGAAYAGRLRNGNNVTWIDCNYASGQAQVGGEFLIRCGALEDIAKNQKGYAEIVIKTDGRLVASVFKGKSIGKRPGYFEREISAELSCRAGRD